MTNSTDDLSTSRRLMSDALAPCVTVRPGAGARVMHSDDARLPSPAATVLRDVPDPVPDQLLVAVEEAPDDLDDDVGDDDLLDGAEDPLDGAEDPLDASDCPELDESWQWSS